MKSLYPIAYFLSLFAFAVYLTSCGKQEGAAVKQSKPAAVQVEVAEAGEFRVTMALTGSVEAATAAILSSPAEGPVVYAKAREGDKVAQAEELFRIGRKASADAVVASARAQLAQVEEDFRRVEKLVSTGSVSQDQLDLARSKLEQARAGLAQAEQQSGDYTVLAPWNGVVSKVNALRGSYVAPRAPLAEIYDPASLVLRFAVPEEHALQIAEGTELEAHFDAHPGETISLRVTRAFGDIDRKMRQRIFEAALPEDKKFLPGMFARLRVVTGVLPRAITLPEASLMPSADGLFVFVVEDGKAVHRAVTTGITQDGRAVIVDGLVGGEAVIVSGQERAKHGAPVKVASGNDKSTDVQRQKSQQ